MRVSRGNCLFTVFAIKGLEIIIYVDHTQVAQFQFRDKLRCRWRAIRVLLNYD